MSTKVRYGKRSRYTTEPAPSDVLAAAHLGHTSMRAVADELRVSSGMLYRTLEGERGLRQTLHRILVTNRKALLLREYKGLAVSLGHTPSAHELNAHGLWVRRLQQNFGSLTNAARVAGLKPRARGTWVDEPSRKARLRAAREAREGHNGNE